MPQRKVQESGGSDTREGVYISSDESVELAGSRGTANFALKFARDSKKEATVVVEEVKGVTRSYTADDVPNFVPLMGFDCRGLDLISFSPQGGWIVESTGGKKFHDVDLSQKEWVDYDDDAGCSVGVYDFQSKIQLHKQK